MRTDEHRFISVGVEESLDNQDLLEAASMDSRKIALRRWSLFLLFWSVSAVFGGTLKWQWMAPLAGVYIAFLCLGWWEEARRLVESDKGFAPLMIALIVLAPPIGITSLLIWLSFRKKHCTGEVLVMPEMYVWRVIPLALLAKLAADAFILSAFKPSGRYLSLNPLFAIVILWHALLLYLPLAPGLQRTGQIIRKFVAVLFFAVTAPYLYYLWKALASINGPSWGGLFSGPGWTYVLGYSPDIRLVKDMDALCVNLFWVGVYGYGTIVVTAEVLVVVVIVALLTRPVSPLGFTAFSAILLFPVAVLSGLIHQTVMGELSSLSEVLHFCVTTSWRVVLPLLVGFDVLQLCASWFSINLREIHSRWDFLRIQRDIALQRRVFRGTTLGLATAIYLSLIAVGAINTAGLYQILCSPLPPAPRLPEGQANAFDIMQERFMKKTSPELPEPSPLAHSAKGGKWGYLFTSEEKAEFDAYWNANLPYFEDFKRAAEAGIYQHRPRKVHWIKAKYPNFLNIRRAAYVIATRAEIQLGEGKTQEAIETAATVLRFGGMVQTEGTEVQRMIGVAVKNIALDEFRAIYQWNKTNDADIEHLFRTLQSVLRNARRGAWDENTDLGLPDYEVGLKWPARLSVCAAFTIPGRAKASVQLDLKIMRFDTLYLGAACRVYRARHGRYPSAPKELIPEILPLWPRDPWSRRPYVLEVNGDCLIIRTVQPPSETGTPGVRLEYPETQETKTTERMEQPSRNRTRL